MRLNQQQILNHLGPRYAAALKSVANDGRRRAGLPGYAPLSNCPFHKAGSLEVSGIST